MKDLADAILTGYLEDIDMSKDLRAQAGIVQAFKTASSDDEPKHILTAYSRSATFTKRINNDMAKNTYHQLTLYCTPLNCRILARTQDGIQAFIALLFHRSLDQYLCEGDVTLYRGFLLDNEIVLEGYENGSTIISTTFLSTSETQLVAEIFSGSFCAQKKSNISSMYIRNS